MSQWTGCRGEERNGGDTGCGGSRNGLDVAVKREMEVTQVVEEVAMDRMSW